MRCFEAERTWTEGCFREGLAVRVDDAGRIVSVGDGRVAGDQVVRLPGTALIPAFVNAHSHAFQVLLRGRRPAGTGAPVRSFPEWVHRLLYPLVEELDEEMLRDAALLAYAEMARAGVGTVGEFHYVHNRRGDFAPQGERYAAVMIEAAREVGLRVALLRTFYDTADRPGRRRFAETADAAVSATRALAARHAGDPCVRVLPAPHSLHGASAAMVRAGAALAAELDTRWHIHLAERREDVATARERFGATPLFALEALGVLDARTVLVHGIWLDGAEVALAGARGADLVANPRTNLELGDGIAPLADLLAAGVRVGLGTDANTAGDILGEMRTAEGLQRLRTLGMGVIDDPTLMAMGTEGGAATLGLATGRIAPGWPADLVALDLEDASLWPGAWGDSDELLHNLVHAAVPQTALRALWVNGRAVVAEGRPLGVDLAALRARWVRRRRESGS